MMKILKTIFIFGFLCFSLVACKLQAESPVVEEKVEESEQSLFYSMSYNLVWPNISEIFDYIHSHNMRSSYGDDSNLYSLLVEYNQGSLKLSFPVGSYLNNSLDKLVYEYFYDNNVLTQRVSSTDYNLIVDFLNTRDENVLYLLSNKLFGGCLSPDGVEQEIGYKDNKYYVMQRNSNIEDGYLIIRPYLSYDYLSGILEGTEYLGNYSRKFIDDLAQGLDNKNIIFNMEVVTVPLENEYFYNHMNIKQKLNDNLDISMTIDGKDFYNGKRYYYFGVHSHNGDSSLKTQEVADILGIGLDDLIDVVDGKILKEFSAEDNTDQNTDVNTPEKFYTHKLLQSDKSYYGYSNSDKVENFSSVYFVLKR